MSHLIACGRAGNVLPMKIQRSINKATDDLAREERPVVSMALGLGLLYGAFFAVVVAAPGLPGDIHAALACVPCLAAS